MPTAETGNVPSSVDVSRILRGASLRVTAPRVAVLRAVHGHPHADTESIIGVARDDLGWVSHQAVYDVLRALTDAGLVRRIQPAGGVARYEARVGDNHHHVVCRSCGAIADVDCVVGSAPCLTPAYDSGYDIGEAEIIFWGRCPGCRSNGTHEETNDQSTDQSTDQSNHEDEPTKTNPQRRTHKDER